VKRIALLGMPNTGKSTLFNRMTGARARVGNWPGVTVDLLGARLLLGAQMVQLVDLPGIYDLGGHSEDERVVMDFLRNNRVDLALVMANAAHVERQSALLAELLRLKIPLVLVLNMADEAAQLGIRIDARRLGARLGMPVCLISAKHGQSMRELDSLLRAAMEAAPAPASMLDANEIDAAVQENVSIPAQASHALSGRIDSLLLHRRLGLPLFFGAMFLLFEAVFLLGKPVQDAIAWGFVQFRADLLDPSLSAWPPLARGLLLDGVYSGLATVGSFVPLIVLFFLAMALLEDTGYLSRAAFLMDALMSRLGLDGRSFVMVLMGFGCNVPAIMGTRVMRSRGLRLLTMLVIPLSLCSARLQVFLFLIAALFPAHIAPLVLFSLYLVSIGTALLTSALFRRRFVNVEPLVLEMPPYRFPTMRHILLRSWQEVRHFLKRASAFIVAGVVLVWILTTFPEQAAQGGAGTWAAQIGDWLQPLLSPLGIDPRLTIALIFGLVAKEVVIGALVVIYGQEGGSLAAAIAQHIDWVQAYSFMLFALIYTPCLSTIATLRAEARDRAFTALAVIWPLCLAWSVSFLFYQGARLVAAS
jgi:ferrous iron transport protein B